jgi:hypothetical protein
MEKLIEQFKRIHKEAILGIDSGVGYDPADDLNSKDDAFNKIMNLCEEAVNWHDHSIKTT